MIKLIILHPVNLLDLDQETSGEVFLIHLNITNMLRQHGLRQKAIGSFLLCAFSACLLSFSTTTGGDSYVIYLNDKLLVQQHVTPDADVKTLAFNMSDGSDVLKVRYSHCGQTGTKRSIAIRDAHKRELKVLRFSESASPVMHFKVNEILALRKDAPARLELVYSSAEMPEGRTLAAVSLIDESKASLR